MVTDMEINDLWLARRFSALTLRKRADSIQIFAASPTNPSVTARWLTKGCRSSSIRYSRSSITPESVSCAVCAGYVRTPWRPLR